MITAARPGSLNMGAHDRAHNNADKVNKAVIEQKRQEKRCGGYRNTYRYKDLAHNESGNAAPAEGVERGEKNQS
jgi:hypothetical protein